MDVKYLLFIGICIINPAFQNVGMGFQKMAVDRTPGARTKAEKRKWIGVWIIGLLFQVVVVIAGSAALTMGNASTLGGFAGLGLIFIALFSHYILKEEVLRRELWGMALVVVGTCILGYYSHGSQNPNVELDTSRMTSFFTVYLIAAAAAIVFMLKNLVAYGGAILGILGGTMNGLGLVFQKVVMARVMELSETTGVGAIILNLLTLPYTWLMIVGGIGGLIVVQFGYKYGKAVQVVPGHASSVVLIPVIAGMAILGEVVPPLCLAGIAVITVGVIVTTTAAPGKHAH